MEKKIHRSKTNRMITGICGGLAEYLNIDATIVRILLVVASFISGGLTALAYIVCYFIIPEE